MLRGFCGLLLAATLTATRPTLALDDSVTVTIAAEATIADVYAANFDQVPCETTRSYAVPNAPRGLTELLMICRALRQGGFHGPLTVVSYPNYERALIEVKKGEATIAAESLWEADIDPAYFHVSEPVIRDGYFVSGIYTTPDREDVLGVRSLEELRGYRTALPKIWRIGWDTLQLMGLKEVVNVPHKAALFEVMRAGRVDFIPLEFSSAADLSITHAGMRLVPVPGIMYGLKGARRFAVSRAAAHATPLFESLERGLRQLRRSGEIERAFRESGFFNPRVASWERIF